MGLLDWLFGKKEAGAKPTSKAAETEPRAEAAWRQLITDCPKCGTQFRWLDKGSSEEAPFCPTCGYDAIYAGKRRAVAPGHPQAAILPPLPSGIVSCDKCGATNRKTGAPLEAFMPFSLSRCQNCRKSFCIRDGCGGYACSTGEKPCPHCGESARLLTEDYEFV